jgi:phospholipase D-like protein
VLAAVSGSDFPLQNIIWTIFMFFGVALWVWLLVVVVTDVVGRPDLAMWARIGWIVLAFVLPILGPLGYLATRSGDVGELRFTGRRSTPLDTDDYMRTVTGDGQYHGLHDETTFRRDMSGPVRPA